MYCTSPALGDNDADLDCNTNCFAVEVSIAVVVAVAVATLYKLVAAKDSVDCNPTKTQRLSVVVADSKKYFYIINIF